MNINQEREDFMLIVKCILGREILAVNDTPCAMTYKMYAHQWSNYSYYRHTWKLTLKKFYFHSSHNFRGTLHLLIALHTSDAESRLNAKEICLEFQREKNVNTFSMYGKLFNSIGLENSIFYQIYSISRGLTFDMHFFFLECEIFLLSFLT